MIHTPQCALCKHFEGHKGTRNICSAFLKGIPVAIWNNEFDHSKPYPGGNDIHFEQSEESLQTLGVINLFEEEEPAPALAKAS